MDPDFMITPCIHQQSDEIHRRLRLYNRGFMGHRKDYSYQIAADGKMIGGIVAQSTFETLEIEYLFVEEAYRGRGLGSRLLKHAETLAAKDGACRVLLNTYNFQAPDFYKARGYTLLFSIQPCFGDCAQFFFWKELRPGGGEVSSGFQEPEGASAAPEEEMVKQ